MRVSVALLHHALEVSAVALQLGIGGGLVATGPRLIEGPPDRRPEAGEPVGDDVVRRPRLQRLDGDLLTDGVRDDDERDIGSDLARHGEHRDGIERGVGVERHDHIGIDPARVEHLGFRHRLPKRDR
jgi:hypothetical protein